MNPIAPALYLAAPWIVAALVLWALTNQWQAAL